ncbi:MAG: ribosome-recycling factor, partial [Patescibacteria group bacterium]
MSYDFSKLKANIKETEEWLARELSGVRTGRATPTLLDTVRPEAYGARTSLRELANVSVEDVRTLRVIPWDKTLTKAIEKGITDADLGVGVSTDDQGLRVSFPELTSERRTQLTKIAGDKTEHAKVTLRSHRTDALKALETAEEAGGIGEDEVKRLKGEI